MQLTFEQLLTIVRDLPESDKERLRQELNKKEDPLMYFVLSAYQEYETVFKTIGI